MKSELLLAVTIGLLFLMLISTCVSVSKITCYDVEYLLSQRKSLRNWSEEPVEDETIKTICRNSFGSGFNLAGLELYLSNSTASYKYDKEHHVLVPKTSDKRYQLSLEIGQMYLSTAPCIITVIVDGDIEPDILSANLKAGILTQNLYLLALRHNMGGTCVAHRIYYEEIARNIQEHLDLGKSQKPLILFPIGYPITDQSCPPGDLQATAGNLPTPLESNIDVMSLFARSHQLSVAWENKSVSQQKLSNILWATYGYSLLGTGHRTVPSAYGEYPFQIYICNQTGVYNYVSESHSLDLVIFSDIRSTVVDKAKLPHYMKNAPVLLIFCWNSNVGIQNASDSDSKGRFIRIGYGCCFQNLYLSATAWDIGVSEPICISNHDALGDKLADHLSCAIYPMFAIGIGEVFDVLKQVHEVSYEEKIYYIFTYSDSTISDLTFVPSDRQISFKFSQDLKEVGFCNVTIPKALLESELSTAWKIEVDGEVVPFQTSFDDSNTYLYFSYLHGDHEVKISRILEARGFHIEIILCLALFLVAIVIAFVIRKIELLKKKLSTAEGKA
ncbi:MAG: nitroreductase family protein [Candidatus Bathyarchaeota archaeon]|nr:nitroreductase family protein [Candidatus Bathyarchaeota archaeon]